MKKSNYNFIRSVYSIIPFYYKKRGITVLLISILNQIVDFFSIILLVPIFISITNPDFEFKTTNYFFGFVSYFKNYQIELLVGVILFYILKNYLSIKIIKSQSDYYCDLANSLSVNLLKNYFDKTLLEVKAARNSTLVKDLVFMPNNFVIYVISSIVQLISESFLIILILLIALMINPLATLFLIGITILIILCLYFIDRHQLSILNSEVSEKYNSTFNHLLNAVNGYAEIKINQLEDYFLQNFNVSNRALNKIHSQLISSRLIKPKHTELFLVILISIFFLISKFITKDSQINVLFVSFLFASTLKIIPSINRILIGITNLKSNLYTIDILNGSQTSIHKEEGIVKKMPFENKIELQKISFQFDEAKPLLSNINLTIKKGEIIGLFGESGKGKSTLLNIISTLITPNSGVILCDGKTIDETTKKTFLQNIAYVSQTPFILEGTILENLVLNGESIDLKIVDDYLNVFDLKKTIDLLPNKLQTFIGSNSHNLSGGQLQRLAIIRALLKKPKLLLLDEATNQLDFNLKNNILIQLKTIANKQGLTIITVSHHKKDLESFCDIIYELKNAE